MKNANVRLPMIFLTNSKMIVKGDHYSLVSKVVRKNCEFLSFVLPLKPLYLEESNIELGGSNGTVRSLRNPLYPFKYHKYYTPIIPVLVVLTGNNR